MDKYNIHNSILYNMAETEYPFDETVYADMGSMLKRMSENEAKKEAFVKGAKRMVEYINKLYPDY